MGRKLDRKMVEFQPFRHGPHGQRGSSQVPDSPARRTAPPVLPLARWEGWLHHPSYCVTQAPAYQTPPWPLSISHSPGRWLCCFLQSCNVWGAAVSWSTPQGVETHHKQHTGCVDAVSLRMAEALLALALPGSFRGDVYFHRTSKTTEFGQGTHFRHFRSPPYRHKVRL